MSGMGGLMADLVTAAWMLAAAAALVWLTCTMVSAALHAGRWRMVAVAVWTPLPAAGAVVLAVQALMVPALWMAALGTAAAVSAVVAAWTMLGHVERRFGG